MNNTDNYSGKNTNAGVDSVLDKLDPKVDFVFKRIFGVEENKDVLLDF